MVSTKPHDSSPHSLLVGATDFHRSANILAANLPISAHSFAVVCAHAVELALKSYLLFKGVPENKLKNDPGHNLATAWSQAAQLGLPVGATHPDWLEKLDSVHAAPYLGRYPCVNTGIVLPSAPKLVGEIKSLITQVTTITNIDVQTV